MAVEMVGWCEITEIAEVDGAMVTACSHDDCEEVTCEGVENEAVDVVTTLAEESTVFVTSATVSMETDSPVLEAELLLAMEGCEFVRWVEVGGVSCCWGGVTGVKAERREGYVNRLSSPAASSLACEVEEVDW